MTKYLPRTRVIGSSLAAASVLALSTGAAAQAAPAPTVVDPGAVIAIAGDGTNVAWLHADYGPKGGRPTKITLWLRDASGTAKALRTVDRTTGDLAIGDDANGDLTIVLNSGGTSKTGPTKLFALPADGSVKAHRLRASLPGGYESAPGLHDGVLSFSRDERTRARGVVHATVRLGSLTSSKSRLVWNGAKNTEIASTIPTAGKGVAFVTDRADDVGAIYELRTLRAGGPSKRLSRTAFGGASEAGYGALVTTNGGTRLVAPRWEDGGGHPADRTTYRVPSGTQVGSATKLLPGEQDLGVPVKDGFAYVDFNLPDEFDETGQLVFQPNG
ncbi:hypothetical protein [Patulibacter minatonensis]|uniref:hypothetical protein n=1 Tax=Patulibacter minatonensis TaxID=298163 RepID=UPI0012FA0AD1|nr:hypothetical protein [Patulibacter minatonensis]